MTPDKKPDFIAEPATDMRVAIGRPRSKTWAVRHLAKFFHAPYLQSCTTDEDRGLGLQRLRVMCRHRVTKKAIGVVEVAGPPDALPKAALMAACQRIGIKVSLDGNGGATFEKLPPPQPAAPKESPK